MLQRMECATKTGLLLPMLNQAPLLLPGECYAAKNRMHFTYNSQLCSNGELCEPARMISQSV
jgi:hypothetical protein